MDYKFLIRAHQDLAGSENAKLSIAIGGTTVLSEGEITSTDSDNPTELEFEATGLNATGVGVTVDMVCTLSNDYYVDSSTDRNAIIQQIWYTDKADGTNYKKWDSTSGTWETITSFVTGNMLQADMTAVSGDDQPSIYTAGDWVTCWSASSATITGSLPESSGESGDYPASSER